MWLHFLRGYHIFDDNITFPTGFTMPLFALRPLDSALNDCRWLNSRSREAQFIEAVGEQQARKAAAGALTFPLLKGPLAGSPWLQPRLVEVIPISPDYSSVAGSPP
jgi:hypothetical protein